MSYNLQHFENLESIINLDALQINTYLFSWRILENFYII